MRPFVPSNQLPPDPLVFPAQATPLNGDTAFGELIQRSLDSNLHAPTEHVWSLTFERQLPRGGVLSLSYIGRKARGLLIRRDVAQFNNLHDPATGVDWYAAGTALEKLRQQGVPIDQVPALLPTQISDYFNDMFPAGLADMINNYDGSFDPTWSNAQAFYGYQAVGFFTANDWTDVQAEVDQTLAFNGLPLRFMQPQYGTLSTWATAGNSNYHALAVSFRQRLRSLTLDFNYTWSHSLDDASGLQQEGGFGNQQSNGAYIVNPIRQRLNYANSDFDIRHNINANVVWQLPFGKGQPLLNGSSRFMDALFGGWQLSGIFRWNSGLPVSSPFDDGTWSTNWEISTGVTPIHPIQSCPSKPKDLSAPKLFGNCPGGVNAIYQNFRSSYPGEIGPRNYIRYPGYIDVDLGFGKTWKMPYNEGHQLQLRWDVFNVSNTQRLIGNLDAAVAPDPATQTPPSDWSNFTGIQGNPRVMQIGVRYSF